MSINYNSNGAFGGQLSGSPIIQDRHREAEHEHHARHWLNHNYGSRVPVLEPDPGHIPNEPPAWMRISDNWDKRFK